MEYVLVANPDKRTIGCTLIQSAMGGTVPLDKLQVFDWDVNASGMVPYRITEAQLDDLIRQRLGE